MISIIISSYRENFFSTIKQNIAETIGVPYEIIKIENNGIMGITKAYNKGASDAKFPLLCFVHEDVIFHTNDWGKLVIAKFNSDKRIGLIGIAGGSYKSAAPSSWFPLVYPNCKLPIHKRLIQHYKDKIAQENVNPFNEKETRVACVDGVWFCCKQEIWKKVKFDENLTGFHCYDIDFSLGVNKIANVIVVYDILIEHLSPGTYDPLWVKATYFLHKKWKRKVPVNYTRLSFKDLRSVEVESRDRFIFLMKRNKFKPTEILDVIWSVNSFKYFNFKKFREWNCQFISYLKEYYL